MQIQKVDTGSKPVLAFVHSDNDSFSPALDGLMERCAAIKTLGRPAPQVTHSTQLRRS